MPERSEGASYWREATMLHLSRRSGISYEAALTRHEARLRRMKRFCRLHALRVKRPKT